MKTVTGHDTKSAFLFILCWVFLMIGFITLNEPKAQSLRMAPVLIAPTVVYPFNATVGHWSHQLKDIPKPKGATGNCLPVAVELQRRIVATGRMAWIVSIDPTPEDNISHAVVVYDSDANGRIDSFADNGYVTKWKPMPVGPLMRGQHGKFQGRCVEPKGHQCILTGTLF